jgi:nucleoside-triphosphatase
MSEVVLSQHIFLTGAVQVGKSTLIRRLLTAAALVPEGFRTLGGPVDAQGNSAVHLFPAVGTPLFCPDNRVAYRSQSQGIEVYTQVFDTLGTSLLHISPTAQVILMDELGFMENEAFVFQESVLNCLRGEVPVLGVIKPRSTPFLDAVRAVPNVNVFTVNAENRVALLKEILAFWR